MNQKFIISHNGSGQIIIFLTDFRFWAENQIELIVWCKDNNSVLKGMTVQISEKNTLTLFLLKWS